MTKAARRTFYSLRYRNYRLFFGGQIISQTGSWMQRIALGWYVLQLTHSPFDVGVMAFAQFMPYMAFGLFAGVLTDRLDARRTVIATQVAQLVFASALANPYALDSSITATTGSPHAAGTRSARHTIMAGTKTNVR